MVGTSMISFRKKIAFSMILGLMVLGLGEVMARAYFHWNPRLHWRIQSSAAWRIDWTRRQAKGIEIFRPGIDLFDPLLGWRNKPGFRNTEPLRGSEQVSINSKGVRGQRDYSYQRVGVPRIVVVGDSYGFGWEVNDDQSYSAVLQASLGDVEVINLGIGGYGTDQMLLMLQSEGIKYRPDLIIVGVVSTDTLRNVVNFRDFAKPMFELKNGALELTGTPIHELEWWLRREPWRPKLFDLAVVAFDALEIATGARQERADRVTQAIWHEMRRVGARAGARVLFVFAPEMDELAAEMQGGPTQHDRALFKEFALEVAGEALTLDVSDVFRRRIEQGQEFQSGHWGAPGHRLIADALAEKITSEQLIER